jgi:hypothetical protein
MKHFRELAILMILFSTSVLAVTTEFVPLPETGPIVKSFIYEQDPIKKKAIEDKMIKESRIYAAYSFFTI